MTNIKLRDVKELILFFILAIGILTTVFIWGCERHRDYKTDQKIDYNGNQSKAHTDTLLKSSIPRNGEKKLTANKKQMQNNDTVDSAMHHRRTSRK